MAKPTELKNDLSPEFSDLMYLINEIYSKQGNVKLSELENKFNSYIDSRIKLKL